MDLRDARRLATTCLLLTGALVLWLILLWLDERDLFSWGWPTAALESLPLRTWMWIGIGTIAVLAAGLVGIVFSMGLGARAPTRQVQCGDCRAVFFIPDNGRRPLTHTCPNCKAFGVYEGEARAPTAAPSRPGAAPTFGAEPVLRPLPKGPRKELDCPSCGEHFSVADTGVRPLRVTCPKCSASGTIR